MLKIKLFLVSLLLIGLYGCANGPKLNNIEVVKTKLVYVTMPDNILTPCVPDRPIDKESYLNLKLAQRESYLTDYSISLLSTIKLCNLQLEQARSLNKQPQK